MWSQAEENEGLPLQVYDNEAKNGTDDLYFVGLQFNL